MKENHQNLSVKDIRDWVGPASFQKGESYFHQGAITEPRRQGKTLKARCFGFSAPSYRVEATMDIGGVANAECSCPVGSCGHCKHVAALLLTWLDDPNAFVENADLETSLEQRSKPELIALIQWMLQRYPDLEYLLELPSPITAKNQTAIDPEVIRHQVSHAFVSSRYDWSERDLFEAARDLGELLNLAKQYLEQASSTNAAMIYRVVIDEILQHEDLVIGDESGRLGELVDDCVEGLSQCLKSIQETSPRKDILRAIYHVFLCEAKMGGIGIGDGVPGILIDQVTVQEKELIAGWIRSALPGVREWGQEILGGLLLNLRADEVDDESFLEICRQSGRLNDLVERLLRLGRLDEAVTETGKAEDYNLLVLADQFVRQGHGSQAERLIQNRSKMSQDIRLTIWLKDYAIQRGDPSTSLELATHLLWIRPSLADYLEMKNLTIQSGKWPDIRIDTLDKLTDNKQFRLLVEIFLEEGEIDHALEALEQARITPHHFWEFPPSLELEVAQAAERCRPEQSIQLYLNQIKRLISIRGRGNYIEAVKFLRIVRGLYKRLGRREDWKALLISLRQENQMLRAFQDELNKAGF